ncbi:hypothetical protein ACGC1H_005421 [Rhizoctonia solani]|uniref:G domain-containing protein n=1 Tax=Rhizoctonia solani TaxID=456999 RepID=A0A8H2WUW4_9AGAM|nr:unnamed protein product [Rhizoctonia solani]
MVDIATSDSDSSTTPTETTMKRHRSPDPPPPHETSGQPTASHQTETPAPETTRQYQRRDDNIRILVLGRSGSGKTRIIQTLCDNSERPVVGRLFEPTLKPYSTTVRMREHTFELIDTPGFDNMNMSDTEAYVQIAEYLQDSHRIDAGITGIIFVHRIGDVIQSRSLRQNLQVLIDIFLREAGTHRLTVLESQLGVQRVTDRSLFDEVRGRHSAFDRAWELGAMVSHTSDRRGFIDLLKSYVSQSPIILPIQLDASRGSDFTSRIERTLGYYEQESVQTLLRIQDHDLREMYETRLSHQRKSESQLQQRLKEAELGYSSLRSQLQLQENVEQSEVVQALNDLNRTIDDIGRSISAYLTDAHVSSTLGKDPSEATALDAVDLPSLKTLLDHVDGESSLIVSSGGQGMHIESFFDYSIRHMLCRHLTVEIFQPFHPGVHINLSRVLTTTYRNMQSQASQVIAGKWRSETFKNIYSDDRDKREQHVAYQLDKLTNNRLKPLVRHIFGKDVPFAEDHHNRLRHLIEMAWDWDSRLKGDIIVLGDFIQTSFSFHARFKPTLMEEFEHNPRNPKPISILGTLALGLLGRRAVGGGNPVEQTSVCKATVLTSNIFI